MSLKVSDEWRRDLFPFVDHGIYLVASAETGIPAPARVAAEDYLRDYCERGMYSFGPALKTLERTRAKLAQLVGVSDPMDLALVPNTTEGARAFAESLRLPSGSWIASNPCEFPSNLWPFEDAAWGRGGVVERIPPIEGRPSLEALQRGLEGKPRRWAGVAWSWVQYRDGYRIDPAAMADLARRHGAMLGLDGIQGVGVVPLDLEAAKVDVFYAGTHKWLLGLAGGGFFYARKEVLPQFRSFRRGWLSVPDPLSMQIDAKPFESARRFEDGNLSVVAAVVLEASLDILLSVGVEAIWAHVQGLQDRVLEGLEGTLWEVRSSLEPAHRGPILALAHPQVPAPEVVARLAQEKIWITARDGAIRVAAHLYNNEAEMDRLVEELRKV